MNQIKSIQIILAVFLGLGTLHTNGQCIANAGNDTVICTCDGPFTFYLGGQPSAHAGNPPYHYTWTCHYQSVNMTWTASDFLDDTTSANPQLIDFAGEKLRFELTITDSLGNQCRDTVYIRFSYWTWTLDYKIRFINEGDSVQLYKSIYGGIPPLTYQWSPPTGLSNPNDLYTWASPNSSMTYELTVKDSAGCTGSDFFYIEVYPQGINEDKDHMHQQLVIGPNPMNHASTITFNGINNPTLTFLLYDVSGKCVHMAQIWNGYTLSRGHLASGLYHYVVQHENKSIVQGKLIFE